MVFCQLLLKKILFANICLSLTWEGNVEKLGRNFLFYTSFTSKMQYSGALLSCGKMGGQVAATLKLQWLGKEWVTCTVLITQYNSKMNWRFQIAKFTWSSFGLISCYDKEMPCHRATSVSQKALHKGSSLPALCPELWDMKLDCNFFPKLLITKSFSSQQIRSSRKKDCWKLYLIDYGSV